MRRTRWIQSSVAHSRIGLRIGDIRKKIHEHEHGAQEEDGALNRRQVAARDGVHHVASNARPGEDGLGKYAAGEIRAEVEAEHRDDGNECVFERGLRADGAIPWRAPSARSPRSVSPTWRSESSARE